MFNRRQSLTSLSDEALMERVAERDSRAFSVLYDRYADRLVNYFYGMLWKDREKAQDFMQELFTKVVQKPELYHPGRPFKTWLFSAANNMCKNEYRRMEVRKNTGYKLDRDVADSSATSSERLLDRSSFQQALDAALLELDEVKRSTFEMRFRQDLSIKEIAQAMDCNAGTVKSRLFYTLKELNTKLKHFEQIRFDL